MDDNYCFGMFCGTGSDCVVAIFIQDCSSASALNPPDPVLQLLPHPKTNPPNPGLLPPPLPHQLPLPLPALLLPPQPPHSL